MTYVYRGTEPATPPIVRKKSGPKPLAHNPGLCGTPAGYKQHVRFRDEKCQACKDAYAGYQRRIRAARKAA